MPAPRTPVGPRAAHPPRLRRALASAVLLLLTATVLAPTSATAASTNVVTNPGFEKSTTGWRGVGATLTRVTEAKGGYGAARLHNGGVTRTAVLNDVTDTVAWTTRGRAVTATAWVRTDQPGKTVALRVREYGGATLKGQKTGRVWLAGTGWQQVKVSYTPTVSGGSLDLNVLTSMLPAGKSIFVDGVTARYVDPPAAPAPAGWTKVWGDEFTGSTVSTTNWRIRNNDYNSYESSYLLARNVTQANGILSITAKREQAGGRAYTSGYLDTIGKQNFGVGTRWEIRAKVPTQVDTSGGLWPAFWLRSNQTGGEIDIAEWYGSPHPHLPYAHRQVDNIVHEDTNGGKAKSGKSYVLPNNAQPSGGFHTYAVEVLSTGIYFYVDGVKSHEVTLAANPWIGPMLKGTWNIRMNMQVGRADRWATAPTSTTRFPATFQVDHVRIYRR